MTYSQHAEDQFLNEFFANRETGFFVEIGANDGIKGSNTRALWERGWSGVMVEGSLPTFQALLRNYEGKPRLRPVWAAVGASSGIVTFYNNRTKELCGWNSADPAWIKAMGGDAEYSSMLTPAVTLADLGLPVAFEFLSIDTEGSDYDVLSAMPNWMKPTLIMAEIDKHNNATRIDSLLVNRGYHMVWKELSDNSNAAYAL